MLSGAKVRDVKIQINQAALFQHLIVLMECNRQSFCFLQVWAHTNTNSSFQISLLAEGKQVRFSKCINKELHQVILGINKDNLCNRPERLHQQKIQLDSITYEYICKSWSGWGVSFKKLRDGQNQENYLLLYDWPGISIMSISNKFSQ